ncbi:ABC transporter substrate-binding protein [Bradyrhizobium elkanii]|uniref:ABC transporter substrate-binding protein n=1 Tax=Bradyrhizobium elkanii TaxID=29448 RepID=UPI001BA653BA|nr:ABC transporter substrate-binding protein [Bradyrhizobium elkanii]MBR1165238.1 ABC transporter substrate-binding protein [Bradyrhizobium elkanii]
MSKQKSGGVSRRSMIGSAAGLLSVPFVTEAPIAWAQEKLKGSGEVVVQNFGGPLTQAIRRAIHEPFTKATGIKVIDVVADLSEGPVMAMSRAGKIDWDMADVVNYPPLLTGGALELIDYSLWDRESLEGVPPYARLKIGVLRYSSGMTVAYDERAFPNGGPKNWVDFWDVKKFRGPRGLVGNNPRYLFVIALLADGMARKDIWPLTEDKLDRAFKKLNEIKPHITKWFTAAGEPIQLLINGEYAMACSYPGRSLSAIRQGAPIKMSWDDACLAHSTLSVILKGGPNTINAQKLMAFMNRAQIAAAFTDAASYPAPNANMLKYLPANLIPQLGTAPENASKAVVQDDEWLLAIRPDGKTNFAHLDERWLAWRAG